MLIPAAPLPTTVLLPTAVATMIMLGSFQAFTFTLLMFTEYFVPVSGSTSLGQHYNGTTINTLSGCQQLGSHYVPALISQPGKATVCSCYNPSRSKPLPADEVVICPGGDDAACTEEFFRDPTEFQDTNSNPQCATCDPTVSDCVDEPTVTTHYGDQCAQPGEALHAEALEAGGACDCYTSDDIASSGFPASDYTTCPPPTSGNGLATCTTTFVFIHASVAPYCGISCNSGYHVSSDGTDCVLSGSALPRAKRRAIEKLRKRAALNFVF